jgi:hypothetical protein
MSAAPSSRIVPSSNGTLAVMLVVILVLLSGDILHQLLSLGQLFRDVRYLKQAVLSSNQSQMLTLCNLFLSKWKFSSITSAMLKYFE